MSATLTPPAAIDAPPAVWASEVWVQPSAEQSRVPRSSPGRVRQGLFFAVWAPAMAVAGAIAAVVFAVGSPIAAATVELRRRQSR